MESLLKFKYNYAEIVKNIVRKGETSHYGQIISFFSDVFKNYLVNALSTCLFSVTLLRKLTWLVSRWIWPSENSSLTSGCR